MHINAIIKITIHKIKRKKTKKNINKTLIIKKSEGENLKVKIHRE